MKIGEMRLLDTNILIYSYAENYSHLRTLIWDGASAVSEMTRLETLGFHGITDKEMAYFNDVFIVIKTLDIDKATIDEAIRLRRTFKMKAGDSLIAATALLNNLELYTRNNADFEKIEELKVVNPID